MIDDIRPVHPRVPKEPTPKNETLPPPEHVVEESVPAEPPPAEAFKTPDEAAEEDKSAKSEEHTPKALHKDETRPAKKERFYQKLHLKRRWQALTKKQKIIASIIGAILLIAIICGGVYALTRHSPPKNTEIIKQIIAPKIKVTSTTVASTLTGLQVDPSVNQRPVTGVMIENSDDARPQSGLDQAGVVFEAVAEAGITRFLALYQDTAPSYIGPVRSARPYYLQWCLGFNCDYAHVGGSPDALSDITSWGVKNLDEFYNGSSYERIASRQAPHNVYTSMAQLNQLESSKGYGAAAYTGFPRKADAPAKPATVTGIDINPSSADFASHYAYNASTNNYTRSEGGALHTEVSASGAVTQITPKVVIAIIVPQSQGALDASGAYYTEYAAVGSGQAFIFQDGTYTPGTWTKTSNTSQITFTDSTGKAIKLDAGQTWITVVGSSSYVSY